MVWEVEHGKYPKKRTAGCDDWGVSADLPEWDKHPEVIRRTTLRPEIVIYSPSTQQVIMVELTVPYESRMEQAHTYKKEKIPGLD
ncbi:reverse transcriptase [Elysia marginata]|uniref:Reverse transcriptase n=1 Tax=Elysia marginata TaxID=1093978 RepID=A0AAV4I462_9GAST|nr:reverse transcriptase [Elysia marginata]